MAKRTTKERQRRNEINRRWRENNREKYNAYQRLIHRDKHLGKGAVEHFAAESQYQKNSCAVCSEPLTKSPRADHNHETGQWRGVVCPRCNIALGYYENSGLMQKAFAYLKRWSV